MGFVKKVAKKTAKKAGNAAVSAAKKKINGGCPGASDGKHSYKTKLVGKTKTYEGTPVTWCHNSGCGRQA
jgi:hypothetical protein